MAVKGTAFSKHIEVSWDRDTPKSSAIEGIVNYKATIASINWGILMIMEASYGTTSYQGGGYIRNSHSSQSSMINHPFWDIPLYENPDIMYIYI